MNKLLIKILPLLLIAVIVFIIYGFLPGNINKITFSENNKYTVSYNTELNNKQFRGLPVDLFTVTAADQAYNNFAAKNISLKLNKNILNDILAQNSESLELNIPDGNGSTVLQLIRHNVTAHDYEAYLINDYGEVPLSSDRSLFYKGMIKGDPNSIAAVSIFPEQIVCVFSDENGNHVLGSVKDENKLVTDNYILYNDNDLINNINFQCDIDDNETELFKNASYNNSSSKIELSDNMTFDSVGISFTADYQLLLDNGGNFLQTENFIKGFFNSVKILYEREGIPVNITSIFIHSTPDPYINLNNSFSILQLFGSRMRDNFRGDLAHLLSSGHFQSLGGIAWVNILCQSYNPQDQSGRFGFSNIEDSFLPFPLYSWTVMVVTHELGHNFASKHTHACVWPVLPFGRIGSIDTCVITAENRNCYDTNAVARPTVGTIMSYCHQNGSIDFVRGFGRLPGDTVRLGYALAACIDSALNSNQMPIFFDLLQNYPNPFNPSTTIQFSLPVEANVSIRIYDIQGREVAVLKDRELYIKGVHSARFDAAKGLSSGVYFYQILAHSMYENNLLFQQVKKMVLIK